MLIDNADLVDHLYEGVIKKTTGLESKKINYVKDEGKQKAEEGYSKLLEKQVKEY